MASAQRSIFQLTASQDGAGVVTPSPARPLPKGAQLLGCQLVVTADVFDAPASFLASIEGRNGTSDDAWVVVLQSLSPPIDPFPVPGSLSVVLGGTDDLIPVSGFTDLRLTFVQIAGVPADVDGFTMTAYCKTDYLTG